MANILASHIDNSFQPPAYLIKSTNTSNAIFAFTDKNDLDIVLLTNASKQTNNQINGNHYTIGVHNNQFVVANDQIPIIQGNSQNGIEVQSIITSNINNDIIINNTTISFNKQLDIPPNFLPPTLSNVVQLTSSSSKIPLRYLDNSNQAYISFGSNVGIGTDTPDPSNRLHLYNSDALFEDSFIALNSTGDRRVAEAPLHIRNNTQTNTGVSMKIDDTIVFSGKDGGYIGIGTDGVKGNTSLYVDGTIECSKIIVKDSFEGVINLTDQDTTNNPTLSTNNIMGSRSIKKYSHSVITKVAVSKTDTYILTDNGNLYKKPLIDPENITLINRSIQFLKVNNDLLKTSPPSQIQGLDISSVVDEQDCHTFTAYLTEDGEVYTKTGNDSPEPLFTDIHMIRGGYGYVLSYSKIYNRFYIYPHNADLTYVKELTKNVLDYALVNTNDTIFGVVVYDDGTIENMYEGSTSIQNYKIDPQKFVSIDVSSIHTVISYKTIIHSRMNSFGSTFSISSFAGDIWYIGDALGEPIHEVIPLKHASGLIIDGDIKILGNIEANSLNIVGANNQVVVDGGGGGDDYGGGVGNITQNITDYIVEMNGTLDGFYTKRELDTIINGVKLDPEDVVNIVQSSNILVSSDAWTVNTSNIFNDGGTNGISVCINATSPDSDTIDLISLDSTPALFVATKGRHKGIICDSDIAAVSDESLKKDVMNIDEPLNRIKRINGVFYKRVDEPDNSRRYAGVIAQNVEEVFPEVISTFKNIKTVSYGNMVSLLIEGIKQMEFERNKDKEILKTLQDDLKMCQREIRELKNQNDY